MALQPLDVTQQPTQGDAAAPTPSTFRERKLAELQGEPQPQPGRRDEPQAESEQDPEYDGYPEGSVLDDEGRDSDTEIEEPGALAESSSESDEPEADDQTDSEELSYDALHDKYKSLEQEFSRVTANRKKIEQDYSDGIAENIVYRHQLEDLNQQATQRAQFFINMAGQTASQFEQMDWSQVPPDQVAGLKQQYQQAVQHRDQLVNLFKRMEEDSKTGREQLKQREAEIARNVLSRRIPNWGDEHYMALRDFAPKVGYSPQEFNEITDWRIIDLIHNRWEQQQAVKTVQQVKRKQKVRAPRNRNSRPQPRSADGRYQSAREKAFDKPGDRPSFREMKLRQMERERRSGR